MSEYPDNPPQWLTLLSQVQTEPWRFSYLNLMRRFDSCATVPVGYAQRPTQEFFRLGQTPSLIFAPREIASVSATKEGHFKLDLFSLGIWGANGPVPLHFTEIALNRKESHKDPTLTNFIDMFHHRWLTQFYRAWRSAQSAGGGLDRVDDERFSFYVASLIGHDMNDISGRVLPGHARLSGSPHRIREARNPEGLTSTLSRYFCVPFSLQEFVLHWIAIAPEERTQLGIPGPAAVIGEGALIGHYIPDCQGKFCLTIGPLTLEDYCHFLPNGRNISKMIEWVREFTGYEYVWEVELLLKPNIAPPARIGAYEKLGWTTWLGQPLNNYAVKGMKFEPENYADLQGTL